MAEINRLVFVLLCDFLFVFFFKQDSVQIQPQTAEGMQVSYMFTK